MGEKGSCVFHPTYTASGTVPRNGEHAVPGLGSLKLRYGTHLSTRGWKTAPTVSLPGTLNWPRIRTGRACKGSSLENKLTGSGLKKIYSKVSAESADDLIFRNHALLELGQLYLEKCDFLNAVDCFEKVKTEALQFHLYDNYFKSIGYLLRIHSERLDSDKQESLIREVIQVGSTLSNYERHAPRLHYNQGVAAAYRLDYVESKKQFVLAKELMEKLIAEGGLPQKDNEDLKRDWLSVQYALIRIERIEKNFTGAIQASEKLRQEIDELTHGESPLETISLYDIEASCLILEGQCYREMGDYSKSLDRFWSAHGILKSHRNWTFYYYVLFGLGLTYVAMGNKERAQIFFDLVSDAVGDLQLNALKRDIEKEVNSLKVNKSDRLVIDRERKIILEKTLGEVHFERRFVLLEILYLLASQPGKVFSKEELVDKIWRESYNPMIHDSKVYTSISRLRKLIEPDFKRPIYILNERDGYAFNPAIVLEDVSPRLRKGTESRVESPRVLGREGVNI